MRLGYFSPLTRGEGGRARRRFARGLARSAAGGIEERDGGTETSALVGCAREARFGGGDGLAARVEASEAGAGLGERGVESVFAVHGEVVPRAEQRARGGVGSTAECAHERGM